MARRKKKKVLTPSKDQLARIRAWLEFKGYDPRGLKDDALVKAWFLLSHRKTLP